MANVVLRDVEDQDLAHFFANQLDEEANRMAAFTSKDPTDRAAFDAHWAKIRNDETVEIRTVVGDGAVVGSVLSWVHPDFGKPELAYWFAREHWGKGIATEAVAAFLRVFPERPIYAHVAKDNVGSLRVLEKCGFAVVGAMSEYSNVRGHEVEELRLELEDEH
jgi:RimJ/RimL family protein N-acetyltransferase